MSFASMLRYAGAVKEKLGLHVACSLLLLTAVQFHLPFYMTRPLPNTFALILTLNAYADWMQLKTKRPCLHPCLCIGKIQQAPKPPAKSHWFGYLCRLHKQACRSCRTFCRNVIACMGGVKYNQPSMHYTSCVARRCICLCFPWPKR